MFCPIQLMDLKFFIEIINRYLILIRSNHLKKNIDSPREGVTLFSIEPRGGYLAHFKNDVRDNVGRI